MLTITKTMVLPIGHRLMNYDGGCSNIHGHNIKIEFTFSAPDVDDQGFITDFGNIKSELGNMIDGVLDHAFIVNPYDEATFKFLNDNGYKTFVMPSYSGKNAIGKSNPTMENLVIVLWSFAKTFAKNHSIKPVKVRLYESDTGWVTYTKSEGLSTTPLIVKN